MIPSFLNAPFILDISLQRGMIATLNRAGTDCYIAEPLLSHAADVSGMSLSRYTAEYLIPAFDAARCHADSRALHTLAHCMGATAWEDMARARYPYIDKTVLMAPPLRPSCLFPALRPALPAFAAALALSEASEIIPASAWRMFFSLMLWPETLRRAERAAHSAASDEDGENAHIRIRLEAWLHSGDGLPSALLKDVLERFMLSSPRPAGSARCRVRCYIGRRDRVVPMRAALPTAIAKNSASVYIYPGGHAGMLSDKKAVYVFRDILSFLR